MWERAEDSHLFRTRHCPRPQTFLLEATTNEQQPDSSLFVNQVFLDSNYINAQIFCQLQTFCQNKQYILSSFRGFYMHIWRQNVTRYYFSVPLLLRLAILNPLEKVLRSAKNGRAREWRLERSKVLCHILLLWRALTRKYGVFSFLFVLLCQKNKTRYWGLERKSSLYQGKMWRKVFAQTS